MRVRIEMYCGHRKEAHAISQSVSPDNADTICNLTVTTFHKESCLITLIDYDRDNITTLLSTINDVLRCISVAQESLQAIKTLIECPKIIGQDIG